MKALTIHQPYAELIARGEKRVENRSWRTHYRGPLAIHAGLRAAFGYRLSAVGQAESRELTADSLPRGAIVAVCEVVACLSLEVIRESMFLPLDFEWVVDHPHTTGPWCWILENVRRLKKPIPITGTQGLWDVPEDIARKLKRVTPRT